MIRESTNGIKEILCQDGRLVVGEDEKQAEAERQFRDFMQFIPSDFEGSSVE